MTFKKTPPRYLYYLNYTMYYIEFRNKIYQINFLPPDCMHNFKAEGNNEFLTLDINRQMLNAGQMKAIAGGKEIEFDDKWKAIRYLLII